MVYLRIGPIVGYLFSPHFIRLEGKPEDSGSWSRACGAGGVIAWGSQ
jgi:hypothetical protein